MDTINFAKALELYEQGYPIRRTDMKDYVVSKDSWMLKVFNDTGVTQINGKHFCYDAVLRIVNLVGSEWEVFDLDDFYKLQQGVHDSAISQIESIVNSMGNVVSGSIELAEEFTLLAEAIDTIKNKRIGL